MKKLDPQVGIYMLTIKRPDELPLYYVGQSIHIRQRLTYHRKTLKAGRHDNSRMQHAYNKYGAAAFSAEVLETCSVDAIDELEQWWLDDMFGHPRVMNLAPTATSPNRGRTFGPETRSKVSEALRKRVKSAEERAAISVRMRGRSLSLETRRKMSETKLARRDQYTQQIGSRHHRSIPVEGTNIVTGKVIRFESGGMAKSAGFDGSAVRLAARGKIAAYKGHTWKIIDPTPADNTDEK